jgi:hypothetical protein
VLRASICSTSPTRPQGFELHTSRWQAFGASPEEHFRLSAASMTPTVLTSPQLPYGFRIKQLGWFGYDAVRDGNQIVVAIDEEQYDSMAVCLGAPILGGIAWTTSAGPLCLADDDARCPAAAGAGHDACRFPP